MQLFVKLFTPNVDFKFNLKNALSITSAFKKYFCQ